MPYNPFQPYNPYQAFPQYQQPQTPQQQVVKVNGRNGAETYTIGPNSSALLLDESGTMVWLITADGAGYRTVSPYDITPHQVAQAPDFSTLEQRIAKLEGFMNEFTADSSAAAKDKSSGKHGSD